MTTRGLRVDQPALDALQRKVADRMSEVLAELEALVGHPVNPNSGYDVADWMVEEGFTGRMTPKGDRLSTNEKALRLHVSPVIDLVLEYRGLQKIVGTYIEPVRGYSRFDGRIHPVRRPHPPAMEADPGRERPTGLRPHHGIVRGLHAVGLSQPDGLPRPRRVGQGAPGLLCRGPRLHDVQHRLLPDRDAERGGVVSGRGAAADLP